MRIEKGAEWRQQIDEFFAGMELFQNKLVKHC